MVGRPKRYIHSEIRFGEKRDESVADNASNVMHAVGHRIGTCPMCVDDEKLIVKLYDNSFDLAVLFFGSSFFTITFTSLSCHFVPTNFIHFHQKLKEILLLTFQLYSKLDK